MDRPRLTKLSFHIDKTESKSQVQAQSEKGKRNVDSGLSLKSN